MELEDNCPFCGSNECTRKESGEGVWVGTGALYFTCKEGFQCTVHPSVWYGDKQEVVKRFHQLYLFLLEKPYLYINGCKYKYFFYYEEASVGQQPDHPQKKNLAELMKNYPQTFMEKMEKSIYNLSRIYPVIGYDFVAELNMQHLLYCECTEENELMTEIEGRLDALVELEYLVEERGSQIYRITAKGWNKISELEQTKTYNQGFMAMSFKEETRKISAAFKNAINRSGYIPRRIDEKEHNKQIVPEILFEISRSKFVVVDITYPNYGAYYEAGYAEALGKEVIICCQKDKFQPHFDIAQKSAIVWEDEKDLEERLYRRIEATVGLN